MESQQLLAALSSFLDMRAKTQQTILWASGSRAQAGCGMTWLFPHRPPHGRSLLDLLLSQCPAHMESRSALSPHLCSRPRSPSRTTRCLRGRVSPECPHSLGTRIHGMGPLLSVGSSPRLAPLMGSNDWQWAVAATFPSHVHFPHRDQNSSFWVEEKPGTCHQWTQF